ncbi:MAG: carbamoyltransferase HypF [Ignavibacteriae bacterium]|nr:MAG: carbamoyltransferase HypF [Ignavibacteriota bacterium]
MKERVKISIQGAVQGVGFRPFVFNLASELQLNGWVLNSSEGVFIEAEGEKDILEKFIFRLDKDKPAISFIQSFESSFVDFKGYTDFNIIHSENNGTKTALILPDIAICDKCLDEIFNSTDRRYLYPFTNCTNCGPRFSIIEQLPYDRCNTAMKVFEMCDECREEYENPKDRRFHAQPNACSKCGPHVELWNNDGIILSLHQEAIEETVKAIKAGKIAAVKGIGGFHLICDAGNDDAVKELRKRKQREEKPLALMYPNIERVIEDCEVSELEKRLLLSPESPIVLLKKKDKHTTLADSIAPGNPYLGIMLPYTPLHHILLKEFNLPVVATSGNLSDEPICIDNNEALERLKCIADIFLVHNRPIKRHVDDSIVRVIMDREMLVRRARGYAPLPVRMNESMPKLIAVGAHLKNTIAVSSDKNVFISQHIGDLETPEAYTAFENVIDDLSNMYEIKPEAIACDIHPDYLSSKYANSRDIKVIPVQHHYAHIISCMAENEVEGNALGVSWDGTGLGTDGTIWGGEFLKINEDGFKRFAHLATFKLPGGDKAIKEIWRIKAGVLYEMFGEECFDKYAYLFKNIKENELNVVKKMLMNDINSPYTSSAGRLFDAVASLTGISDKANFEGQAAMNLEFDIGNTKTDDVYQQMVMECNNMLTIDWTFMIEEIINDIKEKDIPYISAKFHNTLAEIIFSIAQLSNEEKIVLSGGCFQNKYLTEKTINLLKNNGFKVYWHQRVPPNDGGISLGQLTAAAKQINKEKEKCA